MHKLLTLQEFPPESCGSFKEWIDEIALVYWADTAELIEFHLQQTPPKPDLPSCHNTGWNRMVDWYWEPCGTEDLPPIVTLDVEATRKGEEGAWVPVLATAYGGNQWFCWRGKGEVLIPFPPCMVVIGHNVAAYDSRYLASEYERVPYANGLALGQIAYIDTMCLATIMRGLSNESMEALYAKCQSYIASGHQAPPWYEHAWTVSLKEVSKRLLGVHLDKSVKGELEAGRLEDLQDKLSGKDLLNYCALDVWVTHGIFRKLYPIVDKQFFGSPVSWVGMTEMSGCRTWLKDWDGFLSGAEAEWQGVKDELAGLVRELAEEAAAGDPDKFPHWDWTVLSRGKHKGMPRWLQALDKTDYTIGSRTAIELLELEWDGELIEWEQINSRQGQWRTSISKAPLPHPKGNERLCDPLCQEYRNFAVGGRLTSRVLDQEGLVEVFDAIAKVGQWTMFRGRYQEVYRPAFGRDTELDLIKPEINPCGTITRRATSPVWVVTPKEREGRIGSDVQKHIVAPSGYVMVYADFDAQESWLMTLLTDAQAGEVGSNEWCRSVLGGDKDQGTDTHSLVAKRLGIPRNVAKTMNFASAYGAGAIKLANTLWLSLNCAYEEAENKAQDFIGYLNGKDGIANTTFATLKTLAKTHHVRTAILGTKIPDSINSAWVNTEFITTRQNWQIQSAGVDCLHTLIVLCKAFFDELEIEAHLTLHRHDAVYWLVPKGHEESAKDVLQTAHYYTKLLAYEQAAIHAHKMKERQGIPGALQPLTPPDQTMWFSSVDVGRCAGDFS